jgi:hypothetical protein
MTTGETSGYNKLIRSIIFLRDNGEYALDEYEVYLKSGGQPISTLKRFFDTHLQIYDITRSITNIIENIGEEYDIPINVIPHKRIDTIAQGEIRKNIVTYQIESLFPGDVGGGKREYKPRHRYNVRPIAEPSRSVSVYGQFVDNYVRFRFIGRTATETEELMVLFRHAVEAFAARVQNNGVAVFRFEEGGTQHSEIHNRDRPDILYLDYLIRTEDLYSIERPIIKIIEIELQQLNGGT